MVFTPSLFKSYISSHTWQTISGLHSSVYFFSHLLYSTKDIKQSVLWVVEYKMHWPLHNHIFKQNFQKPLFKTLMDSWHFFYTPFRGIASWPGPPMTFLLWPPFLFNHSLRSDWPWPCPGLLDWWWRSVSRCGWRNPGRSCLPSFVSLSWRVT